MGYALIGLMINSFYTMLLLLGLGTAINKSGKFFKILEDEEKDNFKKAFDIITSDFIEDFNNSFVSVHLISSNISKIVILFWELIVGDKYIKKTDDGKIIVTDKSEMFDDYKNKINDLNNKIKKYEEKIKEKIKENNDNEFEISSNEDDNEDDNEEIEEINVE
jgi:hypothetical protein